jgi:hypothetical protein
LILINHSQKKITADQNLRVQINVILFIFIRLFATIRGMLAKAPEIVREGAVGKLFVEDKSLPGEVNGTIYGHYKLFAGCIESKGLCVGGPCSSVAAFEVKGGGAGEAERPPCFYATGNDWEYENMPYICRTFDREWQLFYRNCFKAVILGVNARRH